MHLHLTGVSSYLGAHMCVFQHVSVCLSVDACEGLCERELGPQCGVCVSNGDLELSSMGSTPLHDGAPSHPSSWPPTKVCVFLTGERGAKGDPGAPGVGLRGEMGPPGIPGRQVSGSRVRVVVPRPEMHQQPSCLPHHRPQRGLGRQGCG